MTIEIAETVSQLKKESLFDKTVIVIDVLRATSVMVSAMENGAKAIYPVLNTEEVFEKASHLNNALKAGEREAIKVAGFDLGNSPLEYDRPTVQGRDIVLSTTNGTKALLNTSHAKLVLIGAFVNLAAVCNKALASNKSIVILCSGTNGAYSLDDALCGGHIISELMKQKPFRLSDNAYAHLQLFLGSKSRHSTLANCKHYNLLKEKGFTSDLEYCLTLNSCTTVPKWNGEKITV